ncbi:hypothetical protein CB1_000089025 [Camelus ferus]|nr:hypothetical protein CB1_000089025 [Camelus ferus]
MEEHALTLCIAFLRIAEQRNAIIHPVATGHPIRGFIRFPEEACIITSKVGTDNCTGCKRKERDTIDAGLMSSASVTVPDDLVKVPFIGIAGTRHLSFVEKSEAMLLQMYNQSAWYGEEDEHLFLE